MQVEMAPLSFKRVIVFASTNTIRGRYVGAKLSFELISCFFLVNSSVCVCVVDECVSVHICMATGLSTAT